MREYVGVWVICVENLRGLRGLRGSIKFWRGSEMLHGTEILRGFEILACV